MSKHKEMRSMKSRSGIEGRQARMRQRTYELKIQRIKRHLRKHENDKVAAKALKAI
jgi:hypothetical protein